MDAIETEIARLRLEMRTYDRRVASYRQEHEQVLESVKLFKEQVEFYEEHYRELRKSQVVKLKEYKQTKEYIPTSKEQLRQAQIKLKTTEDLIKKDLKVIEQLKARISILERSTQQYGKVLPFPSK